MASLMSCSLIIVNIWDGRKSIKSMLKQFDFSAHTHTGRALNSAIQTKAKIYSGLWQLPKQSNYCSCQSILVYSKHFWESILMVHWPSDYEDDNTELVLISSTRYTFLCDVLIHREGNLHHFTYLGKKKAKCLITWSTHPNNANTAVHPLLPDWSVLIPSKYNYQRLQFLHRRNVNEI